jgi:hypothetical protein
VLINVLARKETVHVFVLLSLLALWGAGASVLLLLAALSGYGAFCSAFTYMIRRIER